MSNNQWPFFKFIYNVLFCDQACFQSGVLDSDMNCVKMCCVCSHIYIKSSTYFHCPSLSAHFFCSCGEVYHKHDGFAFTRSDCHLTIITIFLWIKYKIDHILFMIDK